MKSFHTELAGPALMGDRPISTQARVAALDCLLDDIGCTLSWGNADMVIDYAAERFERGEIKGALDTLRHMTGVGLTGVYRLAAIMHTEIDYQKGHR